MCIFWAVRAYYDIIYIIIYIILIYNILLILSSPPHLLLQLITSHFTDVMYVMHGMPGFPARMVRIAGPDCFEFSVLYKFKMLIVFTCGPVAAPFESSLVEEAKAEVVMINLVGEIPVAVTIDFGCGGLYEE